MKAPLMVLRFLLELAALAGLLFAGRTVVDGAGGWLLGTVLSAAAAVAWGLFVAPKARYKVPTPVRLAVEIAVFAAATLMMLAAGWIVLALLLAGLYVAHRIGLLLIGAPVYETL